MDGGEEYGRTGQSRLIAAGSALGTACNMAVSYANYKGKRPRLSFSVGHGQQVATWDDWKVSPMWFLTLVNHGETPIRVHMVWLHWEPIPEGWKGRILHRLWPRRNWRIRNGSGLTLASVQGLREPPEELPPLAGFDRIYAGYMLEHDPDWLRNIAGTHLLRISVELPGNRWVHGPK
ncbi:hypothetical protein [Streptomyces camelliae]|uniref:Uncharacterized protein n=1 Tax=Streptomyces camelliae TaxID=3004093 RepID=A0ABY7NTN4_9ACTN|nr:hypothetical protein [Streptomyces sp. HUAS 2-6]WBO61410.1 hypothetical protein O1G22_00155 [Streptomyces sp. HUAS 2-6]